MARTVDSVLYVTSGNGGIVDDPEISAGIQRGINNGSMTNIPQSIPGGEKVGSHSPADSTQRRVTGCGKGYPHAYTANPASRMSRITMRFHAGRRVRRRKSTLIDCRKQLVAVVWRPSSGAFHISTAGTILQHHTDRLRAVG
jgi:hypothetical protein